MGEWRMYGEEDGFVRRHPNAGDNAWYQVIRVSWPDDTNGSDYVLEGGEIDVDAITRRDIDHVMYVFGIDDVEVMEETDDMDMAWMMADAGEMEPDYSLPYLITDDASEVVRMLNEYGIHKIDFIAA